MTHPGCRIRSVTHKVSGFRVEVIPKSSDREHILFMQAMRAALDEHRSSSDRRIAGFAMVLWDEEGSSTAMMHVGSGSHVLSMQVPDFARNRLMAAKICEWANS